MSYKQHSITIQFTLSDDDTFDGESNVLTIKNARCHVSFQSVTGLSGINVNLSLWGLKKEYLSQLGCMGMVAVAAKRYKIKIWADDNLFFEGVIATAYADFARMPDVPLVITANPVFSIQVKNVQGISAPGSQKAEDLLKAICNACGLSFDSYGEIEPINNPHYTGDAISCIQQIVKTVDAVCEITSTTLTVWSRGHPRGNAVLDISPQTGMLGYPTWAPVGLLVTTIYTPLAIPGSLARITTDMPNASGDYVIIGVDNILSSELPGGVWQTTMNVIPFIKK